MKNADGSGSAQNIMDFGTPQQGPWDWSRDGKYVLARKDRELWYMTMPDRQTRPLLQSPWLIRNAQFSPDGKFVAYGSSETGNWEVYVSPFPGFGSKWQVSRGGGEEPRWNRSGDEVFYLSPTSRVMATKVSMQGTTFAVGVTEQLFEVHAKGGHDTVYDVSLDGRFLVNNETNRKTPITLVLNWAAGRAP